MPAKSQDFPASVSVPPVQPPANRCVWCDGAVETTRRPGQPDSLCWTCTRRRDQKRKRPTDDSSRALKKPRDPSDGGAGPTATGRTLADSFSTPVPPARQSATRTPPTQTSAGSVSRTSSALARALRAVPHYRVARPSVVISRSSSPVPVPRPHPTTDPNSYYATMHWSPGYFERPTYIPSPLRSILDPGFSPDGGGRSETTPGAAQPKDKVRLGHLLMMAAQGELDDLR